MGGGCRRRRRLCQIFQTSRERVAEERRGEEGDQPLFALLTDTSGCRLILVVEKPSSLSRVTSFAVSTSRLVSSRGVIVGLDLSIHAEPRRGNGRRFRNDRPRGNVTSRESCGSFGLYRCLTRIDSMHARQNVLEKACFWCFPSPLSKETRRRKRNGEEKTPLLDPEERRRCGTPKNGAGKGKEERKKEGRGIFRGYSQGKLRFDPEGTRRVERIRTVRDANSVKRGRRQASWIGTRRI